MIKEFNMNLFYYSSIAGLIGALIVNGFTYLFRFLGVSTSTPWEIAANVYLNPQYIHTAVGIIIGLIGSIALSAAVALFIFFILEWTGYNMAWLKGLICADAFGFVMLGLLHIWLQIRNEPGTNLIVRVYYPAHGFRRRGIGY
jgi:hypothetical protein